MMNIREEQPKNILEKPSSLTERLKGFLDKLSKAKCQ